jgi:hypothetical protein
VAGGGVEWIVGLDVASVGSDVAVERVGVGLSATDDALLPSPEQPDSSAHAANDVTSDAAHLCLV